MAAFSQLDRVFGITLKAGGANQVVQEIKKARDAIAEVGQTQKEVNATGLDLEKIRKSYDDVKSSISPAHRAQKEYQQGAEALSRALSQNIITQKEFDRGMRELKNSTSGLSDGLRILSGSLAGLFSAGVLVQQIDEYTKFTSQLRLATTSQEAFNLAYQDSIRIANLAQTSITQTGVLYARLSNSLEQVGASQKDIANISEVVALALRVSGATATESASAMLQLSQAFGSGVLRGEEFNAVNEASPKLMRLLAESIGVPVAALRNMASEGELTSTVMAEAFRNPALLEDLRKQAAQVRTISGGWVEFKNNLTIAIGEFDRASGVSRLLASGLSGLAKNVDLLIPAIGGLSAALLAMSAPAILTGIASVTTAMLAINPITLTIIGGLTALGLAYAVLSRDSRNEIQKLIDKEYELSRVRQTTAGVDVNAFDQKRIENLKLLSVEIDRYKTKLQDIRITIAAREESVFRYGIAQRGELRDLHASEAEALTKLNIAIQQKIKLENESGKSTQSTALKTQQILPSYEELALKIGVMTEKLKVFTSQEEALIGLLNTGKISYAQYAEGIAQINANREKLIKSTKKSVKSAKEKSDVDKQSLRELQNQIDEETKLQQSRFKAELEARQAFTEGLNAAQQASDDRLSKQVKENDAIQRQIDVLTLGEAAVVKMEVARLNETAAAYEQNAAWAKLNGVAVENITYIEAQARSYRDLAAARQQNFELEQKRDALKEAEKANKDSLSEIKKRQEDIANAATKAAKEASDAQAKVFDKTMDAMDDIFRRGFVRMLKGGTDDFQAWSKSLINTLKTSIADGLYRLLAQPLVAKIVASFVGVTGLGGSAGAVASTAAAASGGGNTLFNLASQIPTTNLDVLTSNFFNKAATFFGGQTFTGSLASGFSRGLTQGFGFEELGNIFKLGFTNVGEQLGALAGTLAPYAGAIFSLAKGDLKGAAFSAAGAAIGSFIPGIGSIAGGLIGNLLGGLFGGSPTYPNALFRGQTSNGNFTRTLATTTDKGPLAESALPAYDNISKAFGARVTALFKQFDLADQVRYEIISKFGKNLQASFVAQVAGGGNGAVNGWDQNLGPDVQKGMEEFTRRIMTDALKGLISSSRLPQGVRSLFQGVTTTDQIDKMIAAVASLNDVQAKLTDRFGLTVDAAGKVARASGLTNDALVTFVQSLATAAGAAQSQSELLVKARKNLSDGIGKITGQNQLPADLAAFDNLLKGINTSTKAGQKTFAELFAVREGFASFTSAIDQIKTGVAGAVFSLKTPYQQLQSMRDDLAKMFGELGLQVPNSIEDLLAMSNQIDYTTKQGLDLALAFPTLVEAFQKLKSSSDSLAQSLGALTEDSFATLVQMAEYQRVAAVYGVPFANNYVKSLPGFASGTNYLPRDMALVAHEGERIVPKADNIELMRRLNDDSGLAALADEVSRLRGDVRTGQTQIAKYQSDLYDLMKKWDIDGQPATRVIA